jgi:hypothetical protein
MVPVGKVPRARENHEIRKAAMRTVERFFRLLTSGMRMLPSFVIIGAQRSGTTSLYNYLASHPAIAPSFMKEVHFLDLRYRNGMLWYRSNFPTRLYQNCLRARGGGGCISGEASPYYISHPHAPKRMAAMLPRIKLIALLRNPVDRAYSHYNYEVRLGLEPLSFLDAVEREEERLRGEVERMLGNEYYYSFNHQHFSYLSRGVYADQLSLWFRYFPREQFFIIRSEDLYDNPSQIYRQVTEFLGLKPVKLREYRAYNYAGYSGMDPEMRDRLIRHFRPHNERLYELLGRDLGWDH